MNKQELWNALRSDQCDQCGRMEGTKEFHSCPYASDIAGDDSKNCNCCSDCTYTCAQDI